MATNTTTTTAQDCAKIMEESIANARKLTAQYLTLYKASKYTEAAATEDQITLYLKAYAKAAKTSFALEFAAAEKPMLWLAANAGLYTVFSFKKGSDENDEPTAEIVSKDTVFNPLSTNSATWTRMADKPYGLFMLAEFYKLCTGESAKDVLGITSKQFADKYAIHFKQVEYVDENGNSMPKLEVSNTKMLSALRDVVSALIGDELGKRVRNADVRVLRTQLEKYRRKIERGSGSISISRNITVCSVKDFARAVVDICNRAYTDADYSFDCKSMKEPKKG